MRTASLIVALIAALHVVVIGTPCYAQGVQPVPYNQSQPVQYGGAQPIPAPAPAQPVYSPPPAGATDTVVLKNGGMIRGTLIEVLPNDHATVQLPSGQSAIIQWGEIHHIERGGAPAAAPVAPQAAPAQKLANTTASMSGPTALVHIESSRPVTLDRRNPGDDEPWVTACESPCDVQLPLNNDYRIVGQGIWASSEFDLEGQPGQRVVIKVNPATRLARTAGIVVAGVGLLAITIGVYVVAFAALAKCAGSVTSACKSDSTGGTAVGVVLILGGVAAMAVGGVMVLVNWRTGQSQEVQSRGSAKLDWPVDDRYTRLPTFRDPSPVERFAPATSTIPLFSGSF